MKFEEHFRECNEALNELVGEKVLEIKFKPYNNIVGGFIPQQIMGRW